jgi:hypothetical protein
MEVMTRAINEVGYENLDGAAVYAVLDGLDYDALGGIIQADWTDGRRATSATRIGSIQFVETEAGVTPTIQPLTDWFEAPDMHGMMME